MALRERELTKWLLAYLPIDGGLRCAPCPLLAYPAVLPPHRGH